MHAIKSVKSLSWICLQDNIIYILLLQFESLVYDFVSGGGHHIGAKPDVHLNFDGLPRGGNADIVGLQTPPRTLTLEEQFPSLEQEDYEEEDENNSHQRLPNGYEEQSLL